MVQNPMGGIELARAPASARARSLSVAIALLSSFHGLAGAACDVEIRQACDESAKIDQYHSQSRCVQGGQRQIDQLREASPANRRLMLENTNISLAQPTQVDWFHALRALQLCAIKTYALKVAAPAEPVKPTELPRAMPTKPEPKDKCSAASRPPAANLAGNRTYCECSGERRFSTTANGWRCTDNGGSGFYGCTNGPSGWSCIAN